MANITLALNLSDRPLLVRAPEPVAQHSRHQVGATHHFSGMAGIASITFAYLAAAHFMGAKLSRFQAALATVLYAFAAGSWSFFTIVFYRRAISFLRRLSENYGVESFAPNDAYLPFYATALGLLIPACNYFMYQVRKTAKRVDASG